jgi:hypothetical protein
MWQYNAAGDINFGIVQNRKDRVRALQELKAEFPKAAQCRKDQELEV